MRTKRELRELAKERLAVSPQNAILEIADLPERYNLSEEEREQVLDYMEKYARTMCRAIGKEYYG